MAGESLLQMSAEVAVALVGFVSVFLVLARRDGSFPASDPVRIRSIVLTRVLSLFFAALPLVLYEQGIPEAQVWRISGIAFLLTYLVMVPYFVQQQLALSPEENRGLGLLNT